LSRIAICGFCSEKPLILLAKIADSARLKIT
jgi:hypothetical protein